MAQPFDITRVFNDAAFSDVTIKFSGREVYCHKLVLCQGNEYFKALCGPNSKFAESKQKVIELQQDDPDAVEVMLRYFYNTPFESIITNLADNGKATGLAFQMSIFIVAKKYMIHGLAEKARAGIHKCISETETAYNEGKDPADLFSALSFLSDHKEHDDEFGTIMAELGKKHLPILFAYPDFRKMLEEEENKDVLDIAVKAVKRVYETPATVTVERSVRRKMECYSCGNEWWTKS